MKLSLVSAAALFVLTTSAVADQATVKPSPSSPVFVTNTSTDPVPVTLQGTGTVAISGTPTVNVGNSPTVVVGNTPSVNVANTPTVNIGNAQVPVTGSVSLSGNSATNPLLVRDVDNPARQPFQIFLCSDWEVGTCPTGVAPDYFQVAANRRLVIEYASGSCQVPPTPDQFYVSLWTIAGGAPGYHELRPGQGIGGVWEISQLARIYADPNTYVSLKIARRVGGTGDVTCYITVSGYTVAP